MSDLSCGQKREPTFMENGFTQGTTRTRFRGATRPSPSSLESRLTSWAQMYCCWTSLPRVDPTIAQARRPPWSPNSKPLMTIGSR